jgi:tetratricopeptide (TPR) repeat protein
MRTGMGGEHPEVAQTLHGLAEIYFWKWKKFEEAEALLQRAIAIYAKAKLLDHPELAQLLMTYASLLSVIERKPQAAEVLERVKAIRAKHVNT